MENLLLSVTYLKSNLDSFEFVNDNFDLSRDGIKKYIKLFKDNVKQLENIINSDKN